MLPSPALSWRVIVLDVLERGLERLRRLRVGDEPAQCPASLLNARRSGRLADARTG